MRFNTVVFRCQSVYHWVSNPLHWKPWPLTFVWRALQVTRKVDILTPLGALYYNTGRYEEALQVYREAVALQPESTDIWLALVSRPTYSDLLRIAFSFLCVSWKGDHVLTITCFTQKLSMYVSGSGFSNGWSYQRGREDDARCHIQKRQLHRMLPPPVCNLQQAWQLHRGRYRVCFT